MFFAFYYLVFRGINGQFPSFFIFLIVTGMYGYLFAQYLFSWESSFFDLLSTIRFDLRKYIEAKLIIYVFVSVITSLLFVPLIIKGKVDLKVFFSALLYNSGFGYFIVFLLSTYNSAKIELNKGIFGNYEGFSLVQFAAVFIVLLLPYSVIFLFRNIISFSSCLLMINMLSILSIINSRKWFDLIVKRFMMRRYFNLSGYRK